MPVITIRLLEGRTRIGTTPLHGAHVIFESAPRTDWGRGGVLLADRDPRRRSMQESSGGGSLWREEEGS